MATEDYKRLFIEGLSECGFNGSNFGLLERLFLADENTIQGDWRFTSGLGYLFRRPDEHNLGHTAVFITKLFYLSNSDLDRFSHDEIMLISPTLLVVVRNACPFYASQIFTSVHGIEFSDQNVQY